MMEAIQLVTAVVVIVGIPCLLIIQQRMRQDVLSTARMVAVMRTTQIPSGNAVAPPQDTGRFQRAADDVVEKIQGENQWLMQENKRLTEEIEHLRHREPELSSVMTAADIDFVRKLMEPKKPSAEHERLTMWRP